MNTNQEKLKQIEEDHKAGKGPGLTVVLVKPNGPQLQEIAELIEQRKVKPVIFKVRGRGLGQSMRTRTGCRGDGRKAGSHIGAGLILRNPIGVERLQQH